MEEERGGADRQGHYYIELYFGSYSKVNQASKLRIYFKVEIYKKETKNRNDQCKKLNNYRE